MPPQSSDFVIPRPRLYDRLDLAAGGKRAIEYSLKMGPVGALMDATLVKPQFSKGFGGLLAGLKHYTETGEQVDGIGPSRQIDRWPRTFDK